MIDLSNLKKYIEEYDIITIFHHMNPDEDAFGAQFALKQWILDNFDNKKVYAAGTRNCDLKEMPRLDEVDDETIKNSLAIVVDTSGLDRVEDDRCTNAKFLIKIDHHPNDDPFGDVQFVNDKAAATCEILALYFMQERDKVVSKTVADYLYMGLLTDTLSFSTSNTTNETLEAAGYLATLGIDIPGLNRTVFDLSLKEFQFNGYLYDKVQILNDHFAYIVLYQDELEKWGLNGSQARNHIDILGKVKDFDIWAMFTELEEEGKKVFNGSIRSKSIVINTLAQEYNGGGHKNAAGVKFLTKEQVDEIIQKLGNMVKK